MFNPKTDKKHDDIFQSSLKVRFPGFTGFKYFLFTVVYFAFVSESKADEIGIKCTFSRLMPFRPLFPCVL